MNARAAAPGVGPGPDALTVVRAGALTTVQDLGRAGYAHLGVPRSGALDEAAHRLANRLLGNPDSAATLETTVTGCAVRAEGDVTAVVTGAPCPVTVGGRPAPWGLPVRVPAGAVLEAGAAEYGVRGYVGFAGGLAAEPVLGSRATDLLSGLGPAPLRDGDTLPLGDPAPPRGAAYAARGAGT
ncbi:biotin-dependent carboxyltransferase family protein, partial [Streptomyces boncukensis]|nr:allophanate hydrolase subunit 2 family protein [Streptomyces boncukensis]